MALISQITDCKNFIKEYQELCRNYNAIDMGLGCPNFPPATFVNSALSEVVFSNRSNDHQYTDPNGHPRLIRIFSKIYSRLLNRLLTNKEIVITAGSSEALFCSIMSLVSPGDEVILFEPYFMVFETLVKMAQGVPKFISLKLTNPDPNNLTSADWKFDEDELSQLFNEKTKVIILNTPHNPTGKVFTMEEITVVADLCKKWNVICIADEVYERMVFKPKKHIRIASLPDMFERTVTLGAGEKSFGVTGWQIGYAYGDENLIQKLQTLHLYTVFSASTPLQVAFAKMFELEYAKMRESKSYFKIMQKDLQQRRDYMINALKISNFTPIVPDGGMYILADVSKHVEGTDLSNEEDEFLDEKFVKRLLKYHSLQTFPVTISCSEENKTNYQNYIRICFVKGVPTLVQASEILKRFREVEQTSKRPSLHISIGTNCSVCNK